MSERAAVAQLVRAARARGEDLTGPDGLLKLLTKTVLETALDEEMSEHLGYDKHAVEGRDGGNSRNGTRAKTVLTDNVGPVTIEVPRYRDGSFEPVIVKKRQRRLGDVDTVVLSLYAKGLTTGEISAHFAEVYGASLSKDRISVITDRVIDEMSEWCARPLLPVYAAIFIDAIYVKVRDGQVGNRPFYAAIGVDLQGRRDVLGLWAGTAGHGESAKFWMSVLAEIKNRGVADVFFIVCDGLKGLPDSANAVFPLATVQTCIIHLIRGSFRYASKKYWEAMAKDLRPIYTAPSQEAAWAAFEQFEETWAAMYPAISRLWRDAWEQFVPFLDYDVEIRRVLCSTNGIESLNARYRRAVTAKGHFPTEQAALKTLYLVTRSLDPKGTGQARWTMRWKPALNAFAVTFADRMPAAENL
ncbi:IS256 family transposase [Luteipulveratus halotolerans]|uniref:Mutator family transposase n=2 Tax=Luteipulveratus halotolerans TaxID=1631356 RepID=A0A0L6CHC9_9MICO|nr:IS256 family transposase [Luteipulveratus halotolerans]KNX36975.1 transposase [Luteipulveratus halotolerans]KNX37709.1 transposase [Luteipulveratus halotolerans]